MKSTKRLNQIGIMLGALLAILATLIGLFCISVKPQNKLTASAGAGTFSMLEGMSLYIGEDKEKESTMRFLIYLSDEDVAKLNSTEKGSIDKTQRHMYYLQMVRVSSTDNKTIEVEEEFNVNAEAANQYTPYEVKQLTIKSDNTCMLYLPLPNDNNVAYVYYAELVKEEQNNAGFWGQNIKYSFATQKETNRITRSVKQVAESALEDNQAGNGNPLTEHQIQILNYMAGVSVSNDTIQVRLTYYVGSDLHFGLMDERQEWYDVPSLYAKVGDMVANIVTSLSGRKGIEGFHCVFENEFESRIVRQAYGFEYTFDEAQELGYLTVLYKEFDYANYAVLLRDNNVIDDGLNATIHLYTTDVQSKTTAEGTYITLTYDYATIIAQCCNGYSLIFEILKNNVYVWNYGAGENTVDVVVNDEAITVSFLEENEDDLREVAISINAEVVEDHEITMQIKYVELLYVNDNITVEERVEEYRVLYSDCYALMYSGNFAQSVYYEMITSALVLDNLDGLTYYKPNDISGTIKNVNGDTVATIIVDYEKHNLFRIETIGDSRGVYFADGETGTLKHTYSTLGLASSDSNLRLKSLTGEHKALKEIVFDESSPSTCEVWLNSGYSWGGHIITLTATYSDSWFLQFDYFETYVNRAGKTTPFALKKHFDGEIKLSEYNPNNLTRDDLKKILGKDSLQVVNTVEPTAGVIQTTFDGASTYTADLAYGTGSMRALDLDGKTKEIQVPLKAYSEWIKAMGNSAWTIMMLNKKDSVWFETTTEVARENLYGLFSVAVFEEKVNDLDYYFKNTTGDGQMTIFDSVSATGSAFYKGCVSLYNDESSILKHIIGYLGMGLSGYGENKMLHSYYFYMDGTNKTGSYISIGGADNADDNDSAIENAGEDFKDKIQNGINNLSSGWDNSSLKKILSIVLGGVVVVAFVSFAYWMLSKTGIFGGSSNSTHRRRKRK